MEVACRPGTLTYQKRCRRYFPKTARIPIRVERPEIKAYMDGCFHTDSNFNDAVFWASVADPKGVFNWNISDRLKDITQPTMIIAGEEDGATTPEQNKFLADNIPGANLKMYKDVGHFCQMEKPTDFNADLAAFIAKVA